MNESNLIASEPSRMSVTPKGQGLVEFLWLEIEPVVENWDLDRLEWFLSAESVSV